MSSKAATPQERDEFFQSLLKEAFDFINGQIRILFYEKIDIPSNERYMPPRYLACGFGDPEFIYVSKSSPQFSRWYLFVPYSLVVTRKAEIQYFLQQEIMPIPGSKNEKYFSLPGFYSGFHGTTHSSHTIHAKLVDPKLSLEELKQIWSESPADIVVSWITECDGETSELPSDFADWFATIVAKHHLKLCSISKKSASVKDATSVTLTFDELECDLEEFKKELKSNLEEYETELERDLEESDTELGGGKLSSSMAYLPTPKSIKSEL